MSNSWFRFKQFKINQDACAMKVSTDACLFGAWCTQTVANKVLDIGTGTGLLAIMYAQQHRVAITAIEVQELCFKQCSENFSNTSFAKNILAVRGDINVWKNETTDKFDLIISNPPFFTNQFPSSEKEKTIARHNLLLSHDDLIECVAVLLSQQQGIFKVMLPSTEDHLFELKALKKNFYLNKKLLVRDNHLSPFKRVLCEFSFTKTKTEVEELTIKKADGNYSKNFVELLKEYYLQF